MSPTQLRATRQRLGFSQEGLGQILGASRLTISKWERGVNPIPRYAGFAVRFVEEHRFDLAGILAASDV